MQWYPPPSVHVENPETQQEETSDGSFAMQEDTMEEESRSYMHKRKTQETKC